MRSAALALALLAVLVTPLRAQAQAPAGSGADDPAPRDPAEASYTRTPVPLPGPVDANTYRVGPGDVLRLTISGPLTRDVLMTVGPEGTLSLPGAGTLVVRDRTLAQTRALVLERLRRDIRGAELDLRLERPRTSRRSKIGRAHV